MEKAQVIIQRFKENLSVNPFPLSCSSLLRLFRFTKLQFTHVKRGVHSACPTTTEHERAVNSEVLYK